MDMDLKTLLGPIGPGTFHEQHWGRRPLLLSRGTPGFYEHLLSLDDVERLLGTHRFRDADVRLVRNGKILRDKRTRLGDDSLDLVTVYGELSRGATILVMDAHRHLRPLAALCSRLAHELGHVVAANLYLTPSQAYGFEPHYDHHDVFILQIHGSKTWRLYPEYVRHPKPPEQPHVDPARIGELEREVELLPGDLLYLPRGFVHQAVTSDRPSLHVTVGVHVLTWSDLIAQALTAVTSRDPAFRDAVPRALSTGGPVTAEHERTLRSLIERLAEAVDAGEAAARLTGRLIDATHPVPGEQLSAILLRDEICSTSIVRHRRGMTPVVDRAEGSVTVHFQGNRLRGPEQLEPPLRFIAATQEFEVASIPGDLSDDDRVALVRRFIADGLLTNAPLDG